MNICFFTPIFPPKFSGATFQALTLAKVLRNKGHIIFFVTLTEDRSKTKTKEVFDGLDVFYVFVRDHSKMVEGNCSLIDNLSLTWRLFSVFFKLKHRYSIIHSHILEYPFTSLSIFGRILGKYTVSKVTMLQELEFKNTGRFFGRLNNYFVTKTDKLIATSSAIKRGLENQGINEKKIAVIPNGVDIKKFYPISLKKRMSLKESLLTEKRIVVSFVGGISYRKGIDSLVSFWPEVIKAVPDSILILVGPRSEEEGVAGDKLCYEEVKNSIESFHMEQNIILTGMVSNVNEYLQISDLFVFPSTMEGMPNVIIEAMACGTPVVSFRVSGVDDIIRSGIDGVSVEEGDTVAFKEAVLSLLQNSSKRTELAKKAYQRISGRFSAEQIAQEYVYLYESLQHKNQF